jgi:hypothetical protein
MSVILAVLEAEIRRIKVHSQPQADSLGNPISKIPNTNRADSTVHDSQVMETAKMPHH